MQLILAKLASGLAQLEAMIQGQIMEYEEMIPGTLNVNRRYMYAALLWCTSNYAEYCDTARELLGGGPFQVPADISVLGDPALAEKFEEYWSTPDETAVQRMKVQKLAWDLLGTDFAGRHTQYEKFYAGPSFVVTNYSYIYCNWEALDDRLQETLDGYDVPEEYKDA